MSKSLEELNKLDKSMKQLTLDLAKYPEFDPKYQQTLNLLNQQYQYCKMILALKDDGINNTYYFKYSNIGDIETILTNAGYIKKSKKPATR